MSIDLEGVSKRFDVHKAVDNVSLSVHAGEFFVFLGPSGCGKTTLLRLISGLEQPDTGTIAIDGTQVSGSDRHVPPEDRGIGMVFQSYALWPHMTVEKNVAFPAETRLKGAALEAHVKACLQTVNLVEFAQRKPAELSGGQRQRVALARCLAQEAKTILMDEPLANLDPHLRGTMEEELKQFQQKSGATVLYITHDQREAMALADRIAVMSEGRLLQVAAPDDLYSRPASEMVASFVGRSTIVPGTLGNSEAAARRVQVTEAINCEALGPKGLAAGEVRLVIRPENVIMSDGPGSFSGLVTNAIYRGDHWECKVAVDGLDEPLLVRAQRKVVTGDAVPMRIENAWVLPPS